MKGKTLMYLLGMLLASNHLWGQSIPPGTETYYDFEEPVTIYRDSSHVTLMFAPTAVRLNDSAKFYSHPDLIDADFSDGNEDTLYACLRFSRVQPSISSLLSFYGLNFPNDVEGYSYGYRVEPGGPEINPTNEVLFKFHEGYSMSDVQHLLNNYNASLTEITQHELYVVKVPVMTDVFSLSRDLMLSGYIKLSQPDFYREDELTNDPLFPWQFYLNNTGQIINGISGTNDVDIDATEAWTLSQGSSNIRVAILDDGVEDHEDITHVDDGYTPNCLFGCKGKPKKSSWHGQACAGIVAGTHNNSKGIRGVAPNVRIIPIRIVGKKDKAKAKAIGKAWDDLNADVLSNSWISLLPAPAVTDAFNIARANGRNGKGAVIVASAGNDGNNTAVHWPASIGGVIAVGSVTLNGTLAPYSQTGSDLSVVTPSSTSGDINDVINSNVRTTDREGKRGQNNGKYMNNFGGTSASAPQVAGIAALLLSIDPSLTEAEVKCRIEISSTDIGAAGYDNDHGFGIANAYYAIALTEMNVENENISGVQKYAASNTITAGPACEVTNTANVELIAQNSIRLVPGFHANQDSRFHAYLSNTGPCGTGPYSIGNPNGNEHLEVGSSGQNLHMLPAPKDKAKKQANPFKIKEQIKVYPNPNQGAFTLKIPLDLLESAARVEVLDAYGRVVWVAHHTQYPFVNVNLTHEAKGLYLVKVSSGEETIIKKVIYK